MEEGGIASWLKKEGDSVEEGEPLVEIETDKATMEYASPQDGVLLKILVNPGKAVPLQTPIAVFGESGESFDLEKLVASQKSESTSQSPQEISQPASQPKDLKEHPSTASAGVSKTEAARIKASPLAKKMAKEQGISLNDLQGSGPGGRIVARDLEGVQKVTEYSRSALGEDKKVSKQPLSMMRKTIAKRLLAGKNNAPHFYLTTSANMEAILNWREELNSDPAVAAGVMEKVSVNDLVMLACSRALLKHPNVNASWQEDYILVHHEVHLAMAVALESGLVTPVIFNCHNQGIRDIAKLSKQLGKKAKEGQLQPNDYTGGTFTVSNLGMTVIDEFTAIINPPQACILAVGRVQKVAHVSDEGQIIAQQRMKMTLSCDHRVVDGMVGAKFLETLVKYLEKPLMMLS